MKRYDSGESRDAGDRCRRDQLGGSATDRDRTEAAPVLAVDGFEGPLDRWVEMARAQKIDLAKLSIATLIGSFATAMETALGRRIDGQLARWGVWTVMAAALTELWSRLLLPSHAPAAQDAVEEAEALRRQLLDRARIQAAASHLEQRTQLGRDAFRRGQPEGTVVGRSGDLTELLRACLSALEVAEEQAIALRPKPPPLWTASNAIAHLLRLLAELPDSTLLTAFLPTIPQDAPARPLRCRVALASTLIAGLESARDGALVLDQDADWMPIRVSRRTTNALGAEDYAPCA
jgi:segregation and condensation protein A